MLRDLPTELLPLTDEQQAIVELTRSFAEREIRPIAREVDEADIETPWEIWHKAAKVGLTGLHASGGVRRRRVHRHVQPVPGAGGAVRRRPRHRQPGGLQRLLRAPGDGAGDSRAEGALAHSARTDRHPDDRRWQSPSLRSAPTLLP